MSTTFNVAESHMESSFVATRAGIKHIMIMFIVLVAFLINSAAALPVNVTMTASKGYNGQSLTIVTGIDPNVQPTNDLLNSTGWYYFNDTAQLGYFSYPTLNKREDPTSGLMTLYEIVSSATWWSAWKQKTGCYYCRLDGGSCTAAVTYTETWTYEITGSVSIDAIVNLINASLGVTVSKSWQYSEAISTTFTAAQDVACFWTQHEYLWTETKSKMCTTSAPITCTSWEDTTTADTPIKSSSARNYGWSTGSGNCNC
ncbi:uncharacterized protein V1518DRAFT_432482 [Limtongia smithiae]|uniref:uncharacterized protein n=1 Tax=Limtongia smithiae TaxID=1125753 RepID=UPI0034CF4AF2